MRILITGGSGFIGTRLIDDLLKSEHTIKIYDKVISVKYPDLCIAADVRDIEALIDATKGCDVIYNLAAEHADDVTPKSLYADVNIGGAENIVLAAKENNINHIIFTSSVAIYGLNRGEPDESFDAQPFNEYGRTKSEAEKIFVKWKNENENYSLTIVRPAVVFGENNRGNVYNLMTQIKSGKFLMVGKGENKKSMGYVGNIAAFLTFCVDRNKGTEIYNFAGKPDLTSNEIITIIRTSLGIKSNVMRVPYFIGLLGGYTFDILAKISGRKFPVSSIRIRKFTAETTVNTDRLFKSDFKEPYSLEEGLSHMIKYEFIN